jgi:hypothetical protein
MGPTPQQPSVVGPRGIDFQSVVPFFIPADFHGPLMVAWINRFRKNTVTLPNRPCCRHARNRECHGYMTLKRTTPAVSGSPCPAICREVPPFPFPPPGRCAAPADVYPFLLPKDALSPPFGLVKPMRPKDTAVVSKVHDVSPTRIRTRGMWPF